jgi:hypothetical protein
VPIDIVGYDAAVAEANGFTIVTHPDGSQESVPVTPEAIALASEWGDDVAARGPKVTVPGNCGSSWIKIDSGAFDVKRIETGYDVKAPVANRVKWAVQIQRIGGLPTINWPVGSQLVGRRQLQHRQPSRLGIRDHQLVCRTHHRCCQQFRQPGNGLLDPFDNNQAFRWRAGF